MTLKDRTCVLQIPLGVGFGGGEARKRFVEQGDDSLLFGEWGDQVGILQGLPDFYKWLCSPPANPEVFIIRSIPKPARLDVLTGEKNLCVRNGGPFAFGEESFSAPCPYSRYDNARLVVISGCYPNVRATRAVSLDKVIPRPVALFALNDLIVSRPRRYIV